MGADILERLEYACTQLEDDVLDFLYLQGGNDSKRYKTVQAINVLAREAAAEIGRLRGEVETMRAGIDSLDSTRRFFQQRCDALQAIQSQMRDPERKMVCDILANGMTYEKAIAPAEAKGDTELPGMWSTQDFTGGDPDERSYSERTPQPADGEAVASAWKTVHVLMSVMRFRPLTNAEQGELQDAHVTIRTTPPAPVQAAPQEGEASAGQLAYRLTHSDTVKWMRDTFAAHGFGIPDRVIADAVRTARHNAYAAHPSACELGAARGLPWDDDVRNILGRPNFSFIGYAQAMRDAGREIPRKAEEEQAYCLHWLLNLYLKHGAGWMEAANAELAALRPSAEAALQHRGDSQEVGRG